MYLRLSDDTEAKELTQMEVEEQSEPLDKAAEEDSEQLLSEAYAEVEEERRIAELRAEKPVEERQKEFKKMLLERGVSVHLHTLCYTCTCI